jgi:UDP-glucose 4-epimerase
MREELLIPIFLKKALAGEPLTISGDGSQYRKFIYVTDIAQAHLLAMEDRAKNETYNLEGRQKVTVLEVAERIRDLLGEHVKITKVPARAGDFGGKDVSAEKVERELGWKAQVGFETGIKTTAEWFCRKWGSPMLGEVL